jgi:hypothetical protein
VTTELLDLSAEFAAQAPADLERAQARLATLAQEVGLEPRQRSRAREVQGLLAITVIEAEEAGSATLRGYGSLAPAVAAVLDQALQEVRAELVRMAARLHRSNPRSAAPMFPGRESLTE